jgi:hypothetical protein
MNTFISPENYRNLIRKYNDMFFKPKEITIDPTKNYTEEEMIELIKQLPDGMRFPLPASWYDKYNIPLPEPMTFKEALHSSFRSMFTDAPIEIRAPAEGGVREMPKLMIDEATQTDPEPKPQEEVASSS